MWIVTNFGFFSAVVRKASDMQRGDNRTLQIRARDPQHLVQLRDRYMHDELSDSVELDYRDYQVRAYCTPEAWGRAMYAASQDIDYDNFKNSVTDRKLHDAYMDVWSAMANAYGTAYTRGSGGVHRDKVTSYYGTGYAGTGYGRGYTTVKGAKYESAFGAVEDDDTIPMYRSGASAAAMIEASASDGIEYFDSSDYPAGFDGDKVDEDDLFPEHSEASIEAMLEKYAPFVAPDTAPNMLSRANAVEWIGTTNSMFKKFLAGNAKWRTYRTGSQSRYEFPKAIMGEMQEHFDIWVSERISDARDMREGELV